MNVEAIVLFLKEAEKGIEAETVELIDSTRKSVTFQVTFPFTQPPAVTPAPVPVPEAPPTVVEEQPGPSEEEVDFSELPELPEAS